MGGTANIRDGWQKNMKLLKVGMVEAARLTLNAQALRASKFQKTQLKQMFEIRTKFTEGSIFPKVGNRYGLIPPNRKNLHSMFARSGTIQEYLEKQEDGFSTRDPQVPTNKARIAKSFKRKISKKNSLKTLRAEKTLKPSSFSKVSGRINKINAVIGMAKDVKWKGIIQIEKMNGVLAPGYYRLRKNSLVLIRLSQKGTKARKAQHWHVKALKKGPSAPFTQKEFDRAANLKLKGLK